MRVKSFFKGLFSLGKFREETLADRRRLHDFIHEYQKKTAENQDYDPWLKLDDVKEPTFENDFVYIDRGIIPKDEKDLLVRHNPSINITKVGRQRRTKHGDGTTVSGIDAVRGYFISEVPILKVEIYLDSRLIHTVQPYASPLMNEKSNRDIKKYTFNAWLDFTKERLGKHELVVRAEPLGGKALEGQTWSRHNIIVAEPLPIEQYENSDAMVPSPPEAPGLTLEQRVNALPTSVHRASTQSISLPADRILVLRIDQLGDLSVSIPALRRLREIVPNAHITALLGPANEAFGKTLDLFDEIIVFEIPDDPLQRRRVATAERQIELAKILRERNFDIAINIAVHGEVNNILHLSGAPITVGFSSGNTEWMTLALDISTHEPKSGAGSMRHSARILTLIEAFGAMLNSGATPLAHQNLNRGDLEQYGIGREQDFVVLHTGARIQFTRWHGYMELAEKLVLETKLKIVIMADQPDESLAHIAAQYPERICAIIGKIPFEIFDTLLSFSKAFVGNDSGPKHFAALRGTPVVSIHSARIGWEEWGQEITGVVMSRKVPCAGCYIHYEPEDCAKDVACIKHIRAEEVFSELYKIISD